MFVINRFNKIYKTTKIFNAFSKGCVSRTFLLCSCQAQNKVEIQNDKANQEINNQPTLQPDSKNDFIKIYRYDYALYAAYFLFPFNFSIGLQVMYVSKIFSSLLIRDFITITQTIVCSC